MIKFINSKARKYRGLKNILSVFLTLLLVFQALGPGVLNVNFAFATDQGHEEINICHLAGTVDWSIVPVDLNAWTEGTSNHFSHSSDYPYTGLFDIHTQDAKEWCAQNAPDESEGATLTLIKLVENHGGGTATADHWTLVADGPTGISGVSGSEHVTEAEVEEGEYILSEIAEYETEALNYTAGDWSCVVNGGEAVLGKVIELHNEDSAVCTIINTYEPQHETPKNATCLIPATTATEEDFEVGVKAPADNLSLLEILDNSGFGSVDVNNDQIDTQVWNIDPSFDIVKFKVTLLGKEAGNTEKFGYYNAGDNSSFSQVFSVPPETVGNSFDVTFPTSFASSIGFAIDTQGTAGRKWFSEKALNNPVGQDNVAVYNPDDNMYILAFEDLPNVTPFNYDGDFNDLVVLISDITCQTCEQTEGVVVSDTSAQVDGGDSSALTFIHSAWTANIPGATWIWSTDPISDTTITDTETFIKTFNVTGTPDSGTLDIASDNFYKVWVNDVFVGEEQTNENNFQLATQDNYNVTSLLVNGSNTIKIEATNKGVEESDFESNPAGVLFKLTWTAKNCENNPPPPPPDDETETVKIKFHKFIDGEPATEESANGVEFGIEWGNGQSNGNTFNLTSTDYTHTLMVEETSSLSWEEITHPEGPILPLQSQCTEGNFVLLGYTYGDTLEDAINAKNISFQDPSLNGIYGDKFVIVWNKTCQDPNIVIEKYGSYDSTTGEITFNVDWEVKHDDVNDFVITDNIPSGTTYVNGSADNGGTFSDPTVTWNLGTQTEGALGTVSFKVTVDAASTLNMWASGSEDNNQGTRKDGTPIVADRTVPSAMFGPAQTTGTPFDSVTAGSFFSLGFTEGNIVVTFADSVFNGTGNDIKVFEVTGGTSYPDERVKVEGWDGSAWIDLGIVTRDGEVDLGPISSTNKIRLTDVSNINSFEPTADGYDVDAVKALHLLPGVCSIENIAEASAVFGEHGELSASSNATIFVNESSCNTDGGPDGGPNGGGSDPVTDPAIVKTVDNNEPFPEDVIVFTVVVTNNSSIDATNITVTDPLPVGITYVSDDASVDADTTFDVPSNTLTWNIPSILAGGSVTLHISAKVDVDASGDITNTASITGGADEGNSDLTNDSSTAAIVVTPDGTGGCGSNCELDEPVVLSSSGGGGGGGGGGGLSSHRRNLPEVLGAFSGIAPEGEVLGASVGFPNTGRGGEVNLANNTTTTSSSVNLLTLAFLALFSLIALNFLSIKVLDIKVKK